jgi:kynurenine formamidase
MSAEATEWLIDNGIKVMGIDSWGWDLPLKHLIQKAKETNNSELFWEAHLVGVFKKGSNHRRYHRNFICSNFWR